MAQGGSGSVSDWPTNQELRKVRLSGESDGNGSYETDAFGNLFDVMKRNAPWLRNLFNAICLVWSTQPSRVMWIAKISFLIGSSCDA